MALRTRKRSGSRSRYLHGTSPREQRRLALLNRLMNRGSLDALALSGGERILEVGSGLGHFAREMARGAGRNGSVVGIERSREQIAGARRAVARTRERARIEFRQGDAELLPLAEKEWSSFDVAHARFLLEHVSSPLGVVRQMVRAVRPGGRIVLEDDDHDVLRLWPPLPGFPALWRSYIRAFRRIGNDPAVGRKLVALLHRAGARPIRNLWIFFGSCAGNPEFVGFLENLEEVLRGASETILREQGRVPEEIAAPLSGLRAWGRRPDAALWFATCWAEGRRRRGRLPDS